jgi:hypothetical protein
VRSKGEQVQQRGAERSSSPGVSRLVPPLGLVEPVADIDVEADRVGEEGDLWCWSKVLVSKNKRVALMFGARRTFPISPFATLSLAAR